MLRNRDGGILTPTAIELDHDGNAVVGETALAQAAFNPNGIATEFKIHMGDPRWKIYIGRNEYDAMMLSAYVLARLKQDAEAALRSPVEHSVITVPAYFNHLQRLATKRAGEIAGFEVLRLVNEPTAAAVDYAYEQKGVDSGNLLVFDLGGGTLDVTILLVDDGAYHVVATDGNHDLGGLDWDEVIVGRIADAFLKEHGKNVRDEKEVMHDLKRRAEETKRALSRKNEVTVSASSGQYSIKFQLTREQFEVDSAALVLRCEELVGSVLELAEVEEGEIDEVLLVGGASRMPMVQSLLQRKFRRAVRLSANPDEAVARGAAFLANREMVMRNLIPEGSTDNNAPSVVDVTSHSLGELLLTNADEVAENGARRQLKNTIIIPRFTPLPAEGENLCSVLPGSTGVITYVTEGETEDPEGCVILRDFVMELGREAGDDDYLLTTFLYDTSGILTARVTDPDTDEEVEHVIEPPSGMTPEEISAAKATLLSVKID
jgi:molecular chaperone DnaK (HSP70)